jgi:hypothetical protein
LTCSSPASKSRRAMPYSHRQCIAWCTMAMQAAQTPVVSRLYAWYRSRSACVPVCFFHILKMRTLNSSVKSIWLVHPWPCTWWWYTPHHRLATLSWVTHTHTYVVTVKNNYNGKVPDIAALQCIRYVKLVVHLGGITLEYNSSKCWPTSNAH